MLRELGWVSLLDELDIERGAYFLHFNQMNDNYLAKIIFSQLNQLQQDSVDLPFNYVQYTKNIFVSRGL
jgi:hypothetical protein